MATGLQPAKAVSHAMSTLSFWPDGSENEKKYFAIPGNSQMPNNSLQAITGRSPQSSSQPNTINNFCISMCGKHAQCLKLHISFLTHAQTQHTGANFNLKSSNEKMVAILEAGADIELDPSSEGLRPAIAEMRVLGYQNRS